MKKYQVAEVFRPNTMPSYTYINRQEKRGTTYEAKLKRALQKVGSLIAISGGSKTGKTVLYRKVVPEDKLIELSGAQINSVEDFWQQIAENLRIPDELSMAYSSQENKSGKVAANGKTSIWAMITATLSGEFSKGTNQGETITQKIMRNNTLVLKALIAGDFVLVIDDFHYINLETQLYLSRILKAELFNGLKVILLTLPHRADDAIKRNPDLIGRTVFINLLPWTKEELEQIARKGFDLLKIPVPDEQIAHIVRESALSPQLMQENCYNLAIRIKEEHEEVSMDAVHRAFGDTVEAYQHYKENVQRMCEGPVKGRSRRKEYHLKDGRHCDTYGLFLLSLSIDPPMMKLTASEIHERMTEILANGEAAPNGMNLANVVKHSESIIKSSVPALDTLEWQNSTLYILDPFLLFYLRWDEEWKQDAIK